MNESMKRLAEDRGTGALRDMAWRCDVCSTERPDDKISVARHVHIYPSGIRAEALVNYCNDNERCRLEASLRDHTALQLARADAALRSSITVLRAVPRRLVIAFGAGLITSVGLGAIAFSIW